MYYIENHHEAIIPKVIFQRVQEEMTRRASKRKVMQKSGKTEQGKYSAKYALSEILVCGECGTPYKRCTWARNGKKRIVWRCVSRLEFGKKYCHNSPTVDEDKLHNAVLAALNKYGAIREEIEAGTLELADVARNHNVADGESLLSLQQRLEVLKEEQALLLEKVLKDMDNTDLNAQLKTLTEEKERIMEQIEGRKQDETQRAIQESRSEELKEFLARQPMKFVEYDDTVTRRLVEQITVVDVETIRVKIRDTAVEIAQKLC